MVAMASFLRYRVVVATVLIAMMVTTEANYVGTDWQDAHATFYGDDSGVADDMGMSTSNMFLFSLFVATKKTN